MKMPQLVALEIECMAMENTNEPSRLPSLNRDCCDRLDQAEKPSIRIIFLEIQMKKQLTCAEPT
jgi:hypothetical protein